jgi:hypothetical protein
MMAHPNLSQSQKDWDKNVEILPENRLLGKLG